MDLLEHGVGREEDQDAALGDSLEDPREGLGESNEETRVLALVKGETDFVIVDVVFY